MKQSEAARVVAMVAAYWPGTDLRDETAQLWEAELLPFEMADGMDAARQLGRSARFMPSLSDFRDAIVEVRDDRLRTFHRALGTGETRRYTFTQYLAEHPEMVPRVVALSQRKDGKPSLMSTTFASVLKGEISG